MPYRRRVPAIDDDDDYIESPMRNRSSILLFLILLLVIGWFLFNRNFSSFGASWGSLPVVWSTSDQPVSVERPIVREPPLVVGPPLIRQTEVTAAPRAQERDRVKPALSFSRDINVIGYSWVTANEVRVRRGPGLEYDAIYLLPENWPVTVLNESNVDNDREMWVHVRFETGQGVKKGWLNRRYLSY